MSNLVPKIGWMLFMFFLCVFAVVYYVVVVVKAVVKRNLRKRPVREDSFEQPRSVTDSNGQQRIPWTYENMKHGRINE